jgi:nickel/cobalt exporter
MKRWVLLSGFLVAAVLWGHPMGNFSVSHYSRVEVSGRGIAVRYVLDLAEIPTFQLLQEWKLEAASPRAELERRAAQQAHEWIRNLRFGVNGREATPRFERAAMQLDKGAGGMPILRIAADLSLAASSGRLTYEDGNFPDRAGWKEIVVVAGTGARLDKAIPNGADRSRELTAYPQDPLIAPPQDLRAEVTWRAPAPPPAEITATRPVVSPINPPPAERSVPAGQSVPGTVVRGDFLSRLMHQGEIGWGAMLVGLVVAFGLGAIHALSPGHGKTIVAAYLVGSRGTPKHALFLGGMVTFTHTVSVFALGLTTLFLSRYVLPEKIYPVLGAISGLSIVWIGATLFFKRLRLAHHGAGHKHHHHHHHHGALVHDHGDGRVHSHMPEGDISMAGLIALGASGGLVPCPSALVLLLSSVALDRVALGLTLLVAFSAGLAVVLSGIGLVVLYAKNLLPASRKATETKVFRYLPVASAAVIVCAGVIMTGVALGVIRPFAGV